MLKPRAMLFRPHWIRLRDSPIPLIRNYSVSEALKADSPPPGSQRPRQSTDQPKKLKIPPALLKFNKSNPDKPRPRRVIDARSFGASKPGSQPANILKGPRRLGARTGPPWRGKKPLNSKPASKDARRRPRQQVLGVDGDSDEQVIELEDVYRELAEKSKPVPMQYLPQPPSLQSLRETWPSLPTDIKATTAGITEKLSLLGARYPNGYTSPEFLGRQLYKMQYVQFKSEQEKAEALEVAKQLAQNRADRVSQKKGELREPGSITFQPLEDGARRSLVESLAQGLYPPVEAMKPDQSPVVGESMRNLRNNESYQAAGKRSQFMAKLESLLVVNRTAKRAQ
ncbi:hypothetical protein BDV19DRAFT_357133 [Aspergillus venezuelensis]